MLKNTKNINTADIDRKALNKIEILFSKEQECLKNKKVLLRCDFNVPINEKGKIQDDFRIKQSIPTINYLADRGAKIILISHLGDPKGKIIENMKFDFVGETLSSLLNKKVKKANNCIGKEVKQEIDSLGQGDIILLENLRFHKGEQENDPVFAKELASLADIYINDAFSCSHRNHASIVGVTNYIPSFAGPLLEKEIKVLTRALEDPWRPLVVVIGGVKISTRIKLIKNLLGIADHVLFGGELANIILRVKRINIGRPLLENEDIIKEIENIDITSLKVHLPIDVLASPDRKGETYVREVGPGKVRKDELSLDIGPGTIKIFSDILKEAKMIIWSGPLGLFEEPAFEKGTKEIGEKIIKNHKAYKIVGGGDTLFAVSKFNLSQGFDHISTGGGAMLSFLSGERLPGIEALKNNSPAIEKS